MRKDWLWVGVAAVALAACTTVESPQAPISAPVYTGPVDEIGGVEPRYEPYNPGTLQDYKINGRTYKIVKEPQNFSETGLAVWYGEEVSGNRTSIGEIFDPNALTAAHPTLPLPSYVRVTNLSNGRRLVVRVNDRGPYTPGRIIDLSRAAAERLNISNNTKVKVDFIHVAPDGTLSGPGTVGTSVAKQSFALPDRPNLGTSGLGTPTLESAAPAAGATRPIDNGGLTGEAAEPSSSGSSRAPQGGFFGAPSALPAGVLETSSSAAPLSASPAPTSATRTAPASTIADSANGGRYLVQVGSLSDPQRAQSWLQSLRARFHVSGKIAPSAGLYRIQLGPFASRQQAVALQQRLSAEAQQQSFITTAP